MKNKILQRKPYARLIKKMFYQTLGILVVAIVTVLLIRAAGQGYIGNMITQFIAFVLVLDWEKASSIYHYYIRNNLDTIMMATIIIFFIIIFRFSLSWFTRYFDEIVAGVDQLAEESPFKLSMSPELFFM